MTLTKRLRPWRLIVIVFVLVLVSCSRNKTYTLSFETFTDQSIAPVVAVEGEALFQPNDPVREGYRFDGWYLGDEAFTFGVMPKDDIKLEARWSKYYEITFDSAGGTNVSSLEVAEGDEVVISETSKRDHYKLTGWSYMGQPLETLVMPSQDMTLTAIWTPAITITFEATVYDRHLDEFVTVDVEQMVEVVGATIQLPEALEYPEYEFLYWALEGTEYSSSTMPDADITLTATWLELSNLPALFIELYQNEGNTIPLQNVTRETYVTSTISMVNTDEEDQIDTASALFKGRGNGSWVDSGDKKGYRIKFDQKQSILGAPESRHWVILANANFDDVTMFRNKLAFNMTEAVFDKIGYVTSAEWVDVYVNGLYQGVYLICEHLRVDDDRVDINSEFGVLDTGYLIEYDAYARGTQGVDYFRVPGLRYPFSMKSPSPDDYLEEGLTIEQYRAQVSYIQALTTEMVEAALGKDFEAFEEVADVDSFVDMYILHELFKNIDTGYSSFFLYRHPGGKLFAGPPWDFDATLGSTPTRGNGSPNGIYVALSVQAFSSRTANEMIISLYATPGFKSVVVQRWKNISPNIQGFVDETLTDEMIETYRFAMGRNFVRWPSPQGYGSPVTQETAENNWASNIIILRDWLTNRIGWLDSEWV